MSTIFLVLVTLATILFCLIGLWIAENALESQRAFMGLAAKPGQGPQNGPPGTRVRRGGVPARETPGPNSASERP
ncbi:MAG: hypothetical protein ACLFOY_09860 [Desulfatibacillaceae bacterium]